MAKTYNAIALLAIEWYNALVYTLNHIIERSRGASTTGEHSDICHGRGQAIAHGHQLFNHCQVSQAV